MGEITDALRRAREQTRRDDAERSRADARPDRFGAAEAARILEEARAPSAPPADARSQAPPTGERALGPDGDKPLPTAGNDERAQGFRIPREKVGTWRARTVLLDRRSGQAEAYRHFSIRLSRELATRELRSVMVVSALRHEGKSTTCCNLALALASMAGGRRTALVDLDLRRPSVARYLEAQPVNGVDAVLRGQIPLREARLATDVALLDVYPVAEPMSSPHEFLAGPALPAIIDELERDYDTVVIDSPPLLLVPDGHLLLPHVGGLVAVMRSRQTRRAAFEQMVERIPEGKLLGSFVNDSRAPRHRKQYGYYLDDHDTDDEA